MTEELLEENYVYDEKRMSAAWRLFVKTGVIDESVVRPMIARSWVRCRNAGVNPWSSDFPQSNENLLAEKKRQYQHSIEANEPVMQMAMSLLRCNVSLMDQENFVFMFLSPLAQYPRTIGSYQHEDILGTGNSTTVAYERKPIRVDGFELYRSVSQGYSGVSAPFLDADGEYFGALNFNSPFGTLPPQALKMCEVSVDLANELFSFGRRAQQLLRSAEFFRPLVELMTNPVVVLDSQGRILLTNEAMREYTPDIESFGYGQQALSAYLDKTTPINELLNSVVNRDVPLKTSFKAPRKRVVKELYCYSRSHIKLRNGIKYTILLFDKPEQLENQQPVVAEPVRQIAVNKPAEDTRVDYIGQSDEWLAVDRVVDRISAINTNAFILGETGTGKELVARAIHRRSGRPGPFVAINCGAIPRDLFAAELFGYEPGAFTGAKEGGAIGKIEAANHGTVFLDEIGEMPLDLQVGLLRVIQEQAVVRLGSVEPRPLDVRFLAATNQNVAQMIEAREFRADLYYRLNSIEINLPPLRNRLSDIPLLVEHFNKAISSSLNLFYSPFSEEALNVFMLYAWPGNVRELRNVVERCLILAGTGNQVALSHLPAHIANTRSRKKEFVPATYYVDSQSVPNDPDDSAESVENSDMRLHSKNTAGLSDKEAAERETISKLLIKHGGNLSKVADDLHMSRTTLYKKMERYHLQVKIVVEMDD